MSYIITKVWNSGTTSNKVILGHWANPANTRYDSPDEYCDFTNYSNSYRIPDSASYQNDGKIRVTVELDNTVDNSAELSAVMVNLIADEDKFEIAEGSKKISFEQLGKEIKTLTYVLRALPQNDLSAGTIYVSVSGTNVLSDGTDESFETAAERSIVLPSVGKTSEFQLNKINPETVYTDGEKSITVFGKMKALSGMLANDANVTLKLKHTSSDSEIAIIKDKIAFLDEDCDTLVFTTDETLEVGEYRLVFEINDPIIRENVGCSITAFQTISVSAAPKYRQKSYGMIALVRSGSNYDFYTFGTEKEYLEFYGGKRSAKGELGGKTIKCNFGESEDTIKDYEILVSVRGNISMLADPDTGEPFWQADYANGDVIINNMLSYEGTTPLKIYKKGSEYRIEGDGLVKVVNSINVWRSSWSISAEKGTIYTLDEERVSDAGEESEQLILSLEGAASMIQPLGGFAVDLKYGVLTSQYYDDTDDGMVSYGISFGGAISLPIKAKKEKSTGNSSGSDEDAGGSGSGSGLGSGTGTTSQTQYANPPSKTSTGDKIRKEDNLPEGQLSAEVDSVLFGEKASVKDGVLEVSDTGFVGIDATFELVLPEDVLGSFVSNAPGLYASVTINTIENQYEINAGLSIKIIECEGTLAFKQINVKNKDVIVPDKIEFYIRDGLKIPIAPPVLFMTGLGGGTNELADTIGGAFDELPPITLLLYTKLEAIAVLEGEFNAAISLEGLSLSGEMQLSAKGLEKVMMLNAGIDAR